MIACVAEEAHEVGTRMVADLLLLARLDQGRPLDQVPVDLSRLEERADAERDRLRASLNEACERLSPGVAPSRLIRGLLRDHPDDEGIYSAARQTIDEATAFVIDNDLLPPPGGACEVGPMKRPQNRYESDGWLCQ